MSALDTLLKRIHAVIEPAPQTEFDVSAPNKFLEALVHRVDERRWVEAMIPFTKGCLKKLHQELKLIDHVPNCQECMLNAQLDVERYMGTRCVWWLDLQYLDESLEGSDEEISDEDIEDAYRPYFELFKNMPRARDYDIGWYGNDAREGTLQFIRDRAKWARSITEAELRKVKQLRRLLRKWDFNKDNSEQANEILMWLSHFPDMP